jgi:hypothetical protein
MGDLTALLLDAKAEYRLQMEEVVTPSIVDTISTMWTSSMHEGGRRDGIYLFQQRLREIPGWNATTISNKTREITYVYPYFEDLIAACIIAQLKIMSSIKLSQEKPTVQLKLPTTDTFLHELYIQTAKRVYDDPFMLQGSSNFELVLAPVVSDAIEKTIRKLIPFKDVLIAYLQNGGDEKVAEEAMNNQSDDSSGGSFRDNTNNNVNLNDTMNESDTDSSDSDVQVPVNEPYPPPEPQDPSRLSMPPLAGDMYTQGQDYEQQQQQPPPPPPPQQQQPPPPQPQQPQQPPPQQSQQQQQQQQNPSYAAPLMGQSSLFGGDQGIRHSM